MVYVWFCDISDLYPISPVNESTSIEWVDDNLDILDDVLYWVKLDSSSIIDAVGRGSGVNALLRGSGCISVVLNENIPLFEHQDLPPSIKK